eukprot:GHVU01103635.1.p1 GENE.GHVU01103635.1~~GHVU01103635.1.p1  ORF type:complete len:461 (-),score=6.49 GHVU01103635.1:1486-2868(-)
MLIQPCGRWCRRFFDGIQSTTSWLQCAVTLGSWNILERFFPGIPFLYKTGARLVGAISKRSPLYNLGVSSFIVSNISCFLACVIFYYYAQSAVQHFELYQPDQKRRRRIAMASTFFFCFFTANVFLSAAYTESPYGLLSIAQLLCLILAEEGGTKQSRHTWYQTSLVLTALAHFCRSNAILLLLPIFFFCVRRSPTPWSPIRFAAHWLIAACGAAFCFAPLVIVYGDGYAEYCLDDAEVREDPRRASSEFLFHVVGKLTGKWAPPIVPTAPVWCTRTFPCVYSYVQARYWHVGLFQSLRFQQLDSIIISIPTIIIAISCLVNFIRVCREAARRTRKTMIEAVILHRLAGDVFVLVSLVAIVVLMANTEIIIRFTFCCPIFYVHIGQLYVQCWERRAKPERPMSDDSHADRQKEGIGENASVPSKGAATWMDTFMLKFYLAHHFFWYFLGFLLFCNWVRYT